MRNDKLFRSTPISSGGTVITQNDLGAISHRDAPLIPAYAGRQVLPLSPLAYWQGTETAGVVMADSSGNASHAYDGAFGGSPTLANQDPPSGGASMGKAALFGSPNGYGNLYTAALNTAFNKSIFSIGLWVYTGAGLVTGRRAMNLRTDANNRFLVFNSSTTAITMFFRVGGGTVASQDFTSLAAGTWYHFMMTADVPALKARFYKNGVNQGGDQPVSGTWTGALNSSFCVLGADDNVGSSLFAGCVYQVPIFNYALSDAQVLQVASPA